MAVIQSYSTSIALTKMQHGFITTKAGNKCLVIPIESNYLTEKDGAVYMQCDTVITDFDVEKGTHGFLVQKLPSEIWKKLGAEAAKLIKLPYLSNLKVFAKKNTDAVEATVIEPIDESEDDLLPF